MATFRYSLHAKERMAQRGVTAAEVEQCVLDPTSTYQSVGKNHQYRRDVEGKRIKVVVAADRDNDVEKFIVTVMEEGT